MISINRMIDKAVLPLALAAVLTGGASMLWTPSADAAKCTSGNGATCEGECCRANATECVAQPCPGGDQPPPAGEIAS